MERTAATPAALLPFTTALALESGGGLSPDRGFSRQRLKKGGLEDETSSEDKSENRSDGNARPTRASGPSLEQVSESQVSQDGVGDLGQNPTDGPGAPTPLNHGGVFSPAAGRPPTGVPESFGAGAPSGGTGVAVKKGRIKPKLVSETTNDCDDSLEGARGPLGTGDAMENDGYVETDPADEYEIVISLDGLAEELGEGAASPGEIVFGIVHYIQATDGCSFPQYSAAGSADGCADTFALVSGADCVFSDDADELDGATVPSATYVLEIDFGDDLDPGAQPGLDKAFWRDLLAQQPFEHWAAADDQDGSAEGALSTIAFDLSEAAGEDQSIVEFAVLVFDDTGSSATVTLGCDQASLHLLGASSGATTPSPRLTSTRSKGRRPGLRIVDIEK